MDCRSSQWVATQILEDRLGLLAIEVREAKIRLVQALLLACIGVVFSIFGLLLLVLASVYAMSPELRMYGFVAAAAIGILTGVVVFFLMSRHLGRKLLAFDQIIAERKKDMTGFYSSHFRDHGLQVSRDLLYDQRKGSHR